MWVRAAPALLLLLGLPSLLGGCQAPPVQLAAPLEAPVAPLGSAVATLAVEVRDLREERPGDSIGVVRMTMGIPRRVRQADGLSLREALELGLRTGLEQAGWTLREGEGPGWALRLQLDRLWSDGYFQELSLGLGLRLHLLDPQGQLRARAERRADLVLAYQNPADFAFQAGEHTRQAVAALLRELELGRWLSTPAAGSPPEPPAAPAPSAPAPAADRCPSCGGPVAIAWRHCAECGAPLPARAR